jgi:hypothetical protein
VDGRFRTAETSKENSVENFGYQRKESTIGEGVDAQSTQARGRSGSAQSERNSLAPTKVTVDNFEGKVGEWENWFHKFSFIANACGWNDQEKLFKLTAALKGMR